MKLGQTNLLVQGMLVVLTAVAWSSLETWKVTTEAPCAAPVTLRYQVVRQINRSTPGFTEGLIYRDGVLYESTGGYGSSSLNRIHLETGQVDVLARLSQEQFGEGLESDGQIFYQLTWKEHRLNEWDASGGLKQSVTYLYEGWGLTRGSRGEWISSDGSENLYFFDHSPGGGSAPWVSSYKLPVMNGVKPETRLNELEFAQGAVFANVFQETRIVRIDPGTGCVTGNLDLGNLAASNGVDLTQNPEWVLNGIAYRPETGTFFITGKNWPVIYEMRIFSGGD